MSKSTESTEFNDPKADVVLVSSDKTSYRVHSYVLKANSSVFRDMLGFDGPRQNSPVPLEEDDTTVSRILRILHGKGTGFMTPPQCRSVLDAADKYDFFHVPNYIGRHCRSLLLINVGTAWVALTIAARINNESLAKAAIENLTLKDWPAQWAPSTAKEIGMDYFCAILRAASDHFKPEFGWDSSVPPWSQIAVSFQVIT